jgi:hypothetical protein
MASKICAISLGSKSPAFTAGNPGPTTAALPPPSVLPSLHDPSPRKQPSTRPILVAKVAQFLMAADNLAAQPVKEIGNNRTRRGYHRGVFLFVGTSITRLSFGVLASLASQRAALSRPRSLGQIQIDRHRLAEAA